MISSLSSQPMLPAVLLKPVSLQASMATTSSSSATQTVQSHADSPPVVPESQITDNGSPALKEGLGNQKNLQRLAQMLIETASQLPSDADEKAVQASLKATRMNVHPDSSFPSTKTGPLGSTSLETVIIESGLALPKNRNHLRYLAQALAQRALAHPLGSFGGGLSWPIPLSTSQQLQVSTLVDKNTANLPGLPMLDERKGALGYLVAGCDLTASDLQNPTLALEKLISSPRGQALGLALQNSQGGISTPNSRNDYTLAAIQIGLDHDSIMSPSRNRIAGFDLAKPQYWGKPASEIVTALSEHLVKNGTASAQTAKLASHLLLMRAAPQLLVKDIPAAVAFGSQAWANLCIAVAKIESDAPGTVANMSFAQVMATAGENANPAPASAQKAALIDWAVAQGVVPHKQGDTYTHNELERIRTTFTQEQNERITASGLLNAEVPSRKEIALAKLKQQFGENLPFEEKLLRFQDHRQPHAQPLYDPRRPPAGLHSMLDIAMMELPGAQWKTSDSRIPIDAINAPLKLGVNAAFNEQFSQTIDSRKKGIATTLKHMISQLPLADRKSLEQGALEFYQRKTYTLGMDFTSKALTEKNTNLLMKVLEGDNEKVYEIDLAKGAIHPVRPDELTRKRERNANQEERLEKFTPTTVEAAALTQKARNDSSLPPASFSSARSQSIANAFVEHLDIDGADAVKHAKGMTSYDKQQEIESKAADFFLNLVPLRSAIVNFKNGNYAEGAFDLALDAFGFLTAGVGTAAKVAKVAQTGLSAGAKALQVGKIIGVGTLNAFNPLDGVGDMLVGAARVTKTATQSLYKGVRKVGSEGLSVLNNGVNQLRGASGSYDLIQASTRYKASATGTCTIADQAIETAAVLQGGKWYGFDVVKQQPYGQPLQGFTPKLIAADGEIKASTPAAASEWLASWFRPARPNIDIPTEFNAAHNAAHQADRAAYERGYQSSRPPSIHGYSPALDTTQLKKLALEISRTPEEMGSLYRRIENLEELPERLNTKLEVTKLTAPDQFKSGYDTNTLNTIADYSPTMNVQQLEELALTPNRTPEEIGFLFRQIERKAIEVNLSVARKFSDEIRAAGGSVTPMPQGFYLSQVNPMSGGECAALSNAMAMAINEKKEAVLIENFFTAMAHPEHANTKKFRQDLTNFQQTLRKNFYAGQSSTPATYEEIISQLEKATASKTLLIGNTKHGVIAGAVVDGGQKTWFYYDPNLGLAKFPTQASMRDGIERALSSGKTSHLFQPADKASGYGIVQFSELHLMQATGSIQGVSSLFSAPITIPRPSNPVVSA
ncbi:hypothetical protein OOJ96_10725 [Pseudomonas sp. 15FMM2]|uniref:Uncharacterized protein n=1 Tax=Pseudomonas imrae TaxID=2992837 RepID=A0ACC7PCA7_9PSED